MSARKTFDTALLHDPALLEEILGRIAEAVFVIDKQGNFLYANRAAYEGRGYTRDEFLKLNARDINLPERANFVKQKLAEVALKGEVDFETIHVRQDGSTFPVEIMSRVIDFAGVTGMIAVARDITERKAAEGREKKQTQLFEAVINSAKAVIFSIDAQGRYTAFNKAHVDAMKSSYGAEIRVGEKVFDFITDDKERKHGQDCLRRVLKGEGFSEETQYGKSEEGEVFFDISYSPILGSSGKVVGASIFARDISARIRAEKKLAESERLYRDLIENSGQAIILSKPDATLLYANPAAARMLGYETPEKMKKEMPNFMPVWVNPERRAEAIAIMRREGHVENFEADIRAKDGSVLHGVFSATPVFDEKGEIEYLQSMFVDLTERKRAEDQVRAISELLETSIDTILIHDEAGKFYYVNEAAYRDRGYTREEFMKLTLHDVDVPESAELIEPRMKEIKTKNELTFEAAHHRKDGSIMPVEVHSRFVNWQGQSLLYSHVRDLTVQKAAQEELHETLDKLESTLRAIPDLMFEVDTKGRIYDYHSPANELLYVPPEAFLGKKVDEVLPKEAAEVCRKAIDRAAEKGWFRGATYELQLPRGPRWFELSIDVKSRIDGKADRLLVISRDVTDNFLAEEAIKRERDAAQMYLDIVNTIVVGINKQGRVIMINKFGAELFGYSEEEIVGKPWFDTFVPYHERKLVKDAFAKIVAGDMEGVREFENAVLCRNGDEKLVFWRNEYVKDSNGKFLFTLSAGEDVTEMHEARYELRENYAHLEEVINGIIKALATTVETRDPYTAGHQRRVAQLSIAMSKKLGWDGRTMSGLRMAATIHDIGKMYVPAEILNKPGKLEPVEFELIKMHSAAGYDIVKDISFDEPVAAMVRQHHERLNGSGYPDGLSSEAIEPGAKIMAVADVVEAMSSDRPYRPGRGLTAALEEVQDRKGELYDPEAVEACVELFAKDEFKFD